MLERFDISFMAAFLECFLVIFFGRLLIKVSSCFTTSQYLFLFSELRGLAVVLDVVLLCGLDCVC